MTNVLQRLLNEIEALTDEQVQEHEPDAEVGKGEQVVGILSTFSQKVGALWMIYGQRVQEAVSKNNSNDERSEESLQQIRDLLNIAEVLKELYAASARIEFPSLFENGAFDTRKGWKIVPLGERQPAVSVLIARLR